MNYNSFSRETTKKIFLNYNRRNDKEANRVGLRNKFKKKAAMEK
jgi:hypothetical protein